MKKALIFITVFIGLTTIFETSFVYAAPTLTRDEKKDEIQARLEERKQLIQEKKEEIRLRIEQKRATRQAQLTERKQERVRTYFGRLAGRFDAVITRLEILIERIESRVAKLSESGEIDTSDVEEQLAEAKELLNEAEADLQAAVDSLDEVLDANDPKAAFEVMRETITTLKSKLKEVHSILVHTIGDIKGLREGLGTKTSTQSAEVD